MSEDIELTQEDVNEMFVEAKSVWDGVVKESGRSVGNIKAGDVLNLESIKVDRRWKKYEKSIRETVVLMYQFKNMKGVFPEDLQVSSRQGVRVYPYHKKSEKNLRMFNRSIRVLIDITLTGSYIDKRYEYRLNKFYLVPRDIEWRLEAVSRKTLENKHSQHNKYKEVDLYSILNEHWEEHFVGGRCKVSRTINSLYLEYASTNPPLMGIEDLCQILYGEPFLRKKYFLEADYIEFCQ